MFLKKKQDLSHFSNRNRWVKPLTLVLLFFFFSILPGGILFYQDANNSDRLLFWLGFSENRIINIVSEVLPLYVEEEKQYNVEETVERVLFVITGVDAKSPVSILSRELNMQWTESTAHLISYIPPSIEEEGGEEDFYLPNQENQLEEWIATPEEELPPPELNGEPLILLYNTHNAEAYKPSDGVSRMEGKNAGVAAVNKRMTEVLEKKHGISVIYSDVIHDYPDYTKSYINSMKTVKQLLGKYKKIQMVIDIHRDAGLSSRKDTLIKIGDRNCAKVMIVIGTEHDNWRNNSAFAEKLAAKADEMYPGLIKCIRLRKDRRYNQNLHPRAMLMEFGSDLNTRDDALNSAELMADVLAALLKEEIN